MVNRRKGIRDTWLGFNTDIYIVSPKAQKILPSMLIVPSSGLSWMLLHVTHEVFRAGNACCPSGGSEAIGALSC